MYSIIEFQNYFLLLITTIDFVEHISPCEG